MERTKEESVLKNDPNITQHEDGVLKIAMQFFADELLPYLEIEGNVVSYGPTEMVQLELHKMFQDLNLVMDDGTWKHFEFQSTDGGEKDLKRFRMYEAVTSYYNGVIVTTYVLYSGKIKEPKTMITEGVNTYQVVPIVMQNNNADEVISKIQQKQQNGESITKADLIPLILVPLMGGEMEQKDRISSAFEIMRKVTGIPEEDTQKIEAMVYAMADKFLEKVELEELKEEFRMSGIIGVLVQEGIEEGIERGLEQGIEQGIENVIKVCHDFGASKEETVGKIVNMFDRDMEEATKDVEKYWEND